MQKDSEESTVFGQKSSIKVGVAIALIGVVWWAASLTADVNTIKTSMLNKLADIDDVKLRVLRIEMSGSPQLAAHFTASQKDMEEFAKLRRDFDLHIALTDKQPTK